MYSLLLKFGFLTWANHLAFDFSYQDDLEILCKPVKGILCRIIQLLFCKRAIERFPLLPYQTRHTVSRPLQNPGGILPANVHTDGTERVLDLCCIYLTCTDPPEMWEWRGGEIISTQTFWTSGDISTVGKYTPSLFLSRFRNIILSCFSWARRYWVNSSKSSTPSWLVSPAFTIWKQTARADSDEQKSSHLAEIWSGTEKNVTHPECNNCFIDYSLNLHTSYHAVQKAAGLFFLSDSRTKYIF